LITQELFSDDELTDRIRRDLADKYNKKSFAEMDVLTKKVNLLKKTSLNGLTVMLYTLETIDYKSR
tara:strand:- start:36 stop:233 length:198 start_codon:yes stop_codon:yes gene_type:complete